MSSIDQQFNRYDDLSFKYATNSRTPINSDSFTGLNIMHQLAETISHKNKHRRSISEQMHSKQHSHKYHLFGRGSNVENSNGENLSERNSLPSRYMFQKDYNPNSGRRLSDSIYNQHTNNHTVGNFRKAIRRTVNKVLPAKDDSELSSNESVQRVFERKTTHHKKSLMPNLRRGSKYNYQDQLPFSDQSTSHDSSYMLQQREDDAESNEIGLQKRLRNTRYSISELFTKTKRHHSVESLDEVLTIPESMIWKVGLKLVSAEFNAKIDSYVQIIHDDRKIANSEIFEHSRTPRWESYFEFYLSQISTPLLLQIKQKRSMRSDKAFGSSFIDLYSVCSGVIFEISIRGIAKHNYNQIIGKLFLEIDLESETNKNLDVKSLQSFDIDSIESNSTAKKHKHKRILPLRKKIIENFRKNKIIKRHQSKFNYSTETLYEKNIQNEESFFFRPIMVTKLYLEREGTNADVSWKPFTKWPGKLPTSTQIVRIYHEKSKVLELQRQRLQWPIEFLLPMQQLSVSSNENNMLDVINESKNVINSGVVIIQLIGARDLRPVPQIKNLDFGNVAVERKAASFVAYHWAVKSFTLPPSPVVYFVYGNETKISKMAKNTYDPDYFEDIEFNITNGSPRFIHVFIQDEETEPGKGGISRSPLLAETFIDLVEQPLELTQCIELQLLKNTNEARLLLYITITGLTVNAILPKSTRPSMNSSVLSTVGLLSNSLNLITENSIADSIPTIQKPNVSQPTKDVYKQLEAYYAPINSSKNFQDVGWLQVKIISALGLGGKTPNGKIENVCLVDYINTRLRTQTKIKEYRIYYDRNFVIPINDIHDILRISTCDVEKNKLEILGTVSIHLLRVQNGESKWYALKSIDQKSSTKGSILLEFHLFYNQVRAAYRTCRPKEEIFRNLANKEKDINISNLRLLHQRFEHTKPLLDLIQWWYYVFNDWFSWKHPIHSLFGFVTFELLVYNFRPYFIPLYFIILIMKHKLSRSSVDLIAQGLRMNKTATQLASAYEHEIYKQHFEILEQKEQNNKVSEEISNKSEDDVFEKEINCYSSTKSSPTYPKLSMAENQSKNLKQLVLQISVDSAQANQMSDPETSSPNIKQEVKKSLRTKMYDIKETTSTILGIVEQIASLYERMDGLFKWRIPWISWFIVIILIIITVVLYFIPLKTIIMIWGLKKFSYGLLRPNAVRNNIYMSILSRVPNLIESNELIEYRPDAFKLAAIGKK